MSGNADNRPQQESNINAKHVKVLAANLNLTADPELNLAKIRMAFTHGLSANTLDTMFGTEDNQADTEKHT